MTGTMTCRASIGLVALALAATAPGCVAGDFNAHKETRAMAVAHVEDSAISVDSRNGSIEIRANENESEQVEIVAKLRSATQERLDAAEIIAERQKDGMLHVYVKWPTKKWKSKDACSFVVLLPDANGVVADTSNGSIVIYGLSGNLVADTSNGSIKIDAHDGMINADTSNGAIAIREATGVVNADTSNGAITVVLAHDNPGPVNLDTSNGSIDLVVGPAFVGTLVADTSVGRVNVGPFSGLEADIIAHGKTDAKVVFGNEKGPKSVVDTSVGSVTVKGRS